MHSKLKRQDMRRQVTAKDSKTLKNIHTLNSGVVGNNIVCCDRCYIMVDLISKWD